MCGSTAFILFPRAQAFGTGRTDKTNTVGFVEEDNQRDTISLLISCLATLGLCVYSAVHLNIPRKAEPIYTTLLRELKWCIVGLFAPELILYTAWRQLASAKQLRFEVEQARESTSRDADVGDKTFAVSSNATAQHPRFSPWTIAHGFYGTMGGFAIDIDDAGDRYAYIFGGTKRLTLTAKGVALLAQCGYIPEIPLDDIEDKNKTDGLAKLLVCVQAGWMIVQVISRSAAGLPTTLLEVHTVAHVVCALIVYILWWHKPRQVASPTIIRGEWVWPLVAYMYLASRISGSPPKGLSGRFRHATPAMRKLAYFEGSESDITTFGEGQGRREASCGRYGPRPATSSATDAIEPTSPLPRDEITDALQDLAAEAIEIYPALHSRFTKPKATGDSTSHSQTYSIPYTTELVQPHSLDWPNAGLLRRTQSLIMGMVLWGASTVYGAIHVAAWDYFFPSTIEQLFWRLSSVWVTFCAAFWLVTNMLARLFPFIDKTWVAFNERRLGWLGMGVIMVLIVMCGVSYVVSRTYLVIEAFGSMREVPEDVYRTPSWSQVFPHL